MVMTWFQRTNPYFVLNRGHGLGCVPNCFTKKIIKIMFKNLSSLVYFLAAIALTFVGFEIIEETQKIADFSPPRMYTYSFIFGAILSVCYEHYTKGVIRNDLDWKSIIVRGMIYGAIFSVVAAYIHYVEYRVYGGYGMLMGMTLFTPSPNFKLNYKDKNLESVEFDSMVYVSTEDTLIDRTDPDVSSLLKLLWEKYSNPSKLHPWVYWMFNVFPYNNTVLHVFAIDYCYQCFYLKKNDDGTHFGLRHRPKWTSMPLMIRYWNWFHDYLESHAADPELKGMYLSTLVIALSEFGKTSMLPPTVRTLKLTEVFDTLEETLKREKYFDVEKQQMDYFLDEEDLLPFLVRLYWDLSRQYHSIF
jgi:hypothetical protein